MKNITKFFKYKINNKLLLTAFALIIFLFLILIFYVPKIYLNGKSEITINFGDKYFEDGYRASLFGIDVSNRILIENNVNYNKVGVYKIEYKINNLVKLFGNIAIRTIKIVDNDAPIINLVGSTVMLKVGEAYNEPGYTAEDNYDGIITNKVRVESNIDISQVGEYEVVYKISDSSSNESEIKRKVVVYEYNVDSVPVLTYHHFMTGEEKRKYTPTDKYTMSTEAFEQQLIYLKNNGYRSITLDDLYLWYTGKKTLTDKDIIITIDDGNISAYRYAIPLLEKYGFTATIFVITGRITNTEQIWDPATLKFFNEEIITDILTNHKSIALASHTHYLHSTINGSCAIPSKTEEEIYNDVKASKEVIHSEYLAYPYGCFTDASRSALEKAGYKMAFSFGDDKRASKNQDIYSLKRLNVNSYTTIQEFISWLEV